MNNFPPFDIAKIIEKVNKINNTYELLNEIFSDNLSYITEPNLKYFFISRFFIKNVQLSFNEVWKLFKVLISVNPNLIQEKIENNNLYAICLKNCAQLLFKGVTNIIIDENFGFKNKEISSLFDYLFSIPLVKHFINLIESKKHKEEIFEILNRVGQLICDKSKISKNMAIKNIFNNFSHFVNINDININNEQFNVNSFSSNIINTNENNSNSDRCRYA